MKPPIKFRTLEMIAQTPGMDTHSLRTALGREYPKDPCITDQLIFEYIQSLGISGLITTQLTGNFDAQGRPEKTLFTTPAGMKKL